MKITLEILQSKWPSNPLLMLSFCPEKRISSLSLKPFLILTNSIHSISLETLGEFCSGKVGQLIKESWSSQMTIKSQNSRRSRLSSTLLKLLGLRATARRYSGMKKVKSGLFDWSLLIEMTVIKEFTSKHTRRPKTFEQCFHRNIYLVEVCSASSLQRTNYFLTKQLNFSKSSCQQGREPSREAICPNISTFQKNNWAKTATIILV